MLFTPSGLATGSELGDGMLRLEYVADPVVSNAVVVSGVFS